MIDDDLRTIRGYVKGRGYGTDCFGWSVELDNSPVLTALDSLAEAIKTARGSHQCEGPEDPCPVCDALK